MQMEVSIPMNGSGKFLLINPNTTELITERAIAAARSAASVGTKFEGVTGAFGVPIINSRTDNVIGSYCAIDLAAMHAADFDGVLLAVSFDSGLYELREMLSIPVAGFTESAIRKACRLGQHFSLISFARRTKPLYESLTRKYGVNDRLAGVRCMVAPTPSELSREDLLIERVQHEINETVRKDGADVAVLCATAFAGFTKHLSVNIPVVDGIEAAVSDLEQYCREQPHELKNLADANFPQKKTLVGVSNELRQLYSGFPDG